MSSSARLAVLLCALKGTCAVVQLLDPRSVCHSYCDNYSSKDSEEEVNGVFRFYQAPDGVWAGIDISLRNDSRLHPRTAIVTHVHTGPCHYPAGNEPPKLFLAPDSAFTLAAAPDPSNHRWRQAFYPGALPPVGSDQVQSHIIHDLNGSEHACCRLTPCAPPEGSSCRAYADTWDVLDASIVESVIGHVIVSTYGGGTRVFQDIELKGPPVVDRDPRKSKCTQELGVDVSSEDNPQIVLDEISSISLDDCLLDCKYNRQCTNALYVPKTKVSETGSCTLKQIAPSWNLTPEKIATSYATYITCSQPGQTFDKYALVEGILRPLEIAIVNRKSRRVLDNIKGTIASNGVGTRIGEHNFAAQLPRSLDTYAILLQTIDGEPVASAPLGTCPNFIPVQYKSDKNDDDGQAPGMVSIIPDDESSSSSDVAAVAGSVVGVLATVACVAIALLMWRRRRLSQPPRPIEAVDDSAVWPDDTVGPGDAVIGLRAPVQSLGAMTSQADWVTMTQWHGGETEPFHAKDGPAEFITMSDCTATRTKAAASITRTCGSATDDIPTGSTSQVSIVMKRAPTIDALDDALDAMYARREPLLGRWHVLNATQRRVGGQGIVQFVKDTATGEEAVVKFFLNALAFQREAVLYAQEDVREVMAAVKDVQDNVDGALTASNGTVVFPPFIVLEKGRSLNEWALITKPDFATSIQVLVQIVDRLRQLHALDVVHRDLKPANILWRSTVGQWTLIDFGCAVAAGSDAIISCTIPYAPPEVAQAIKEKRTTFKADPAVDVWALGVMIYEMLTGVRAFGTGRNTREIVDNLTDPAPLPWEAGNEYAHRMRKLGIVRKVVSACLERDPEKRPTSEDLLCSLDSLFYQATTRAQTQSAPHL